MKKDDDYFMEKVLKEALKAKEKGEIPIGAVIVKNGKIISKSYNRVEMKKKSIMHAELDAIVKAQRKLKDWRLKGCTIYTNVEPCIMCSFAIVLSRIDRVVFGCRNKKFGGIYSLITLENLKTNHRLTIKEGVLKEKSIQILKEFFKELREKGEVVELV